MVAQDRVFEFVPRAWVAFEQFSVEHGRTSPVGLSFRRQQRTVPQLVVGLELHLGDAPRTAVEREREDVVAEHFPRVSA